jgi:hypothetical protein
MTFNFLWPQRKKEVSSSARISNYRSFVLRITASLALAYIRITHATKLIDNLYILYTWWPK